MTLTLRNTSLIGAMMVASSLLPFLFVPTKKLSQQIEQIDIEQAVPKSFGGSTVDTGVARSFLRPKRKKTLTRLTTRSSTVLM